MAALSNSAIPFFFPGSGGLQGKCLTGTLAGGACEFDVGFNVIAYAAASPIHATTAVADQTLTITGVTIPTDGYVTSSNGKLTVKSDVGASTIQVQLFVIGM